MSRIFLFICFICLFNTAVFAQSVEQGNAFNKFMGAEDGINPLSGTAAFKKNLATITSGMASYDVEMSYSSNVQEIVKNKNDIAQIGWVGLGWSLGHAKIVADDAESMYLGDDTYYLQTSTNLRYKIVKDEKIEDKWWIEGLPYWLIKQIKMNVTFEKNGVSKTYPIVIGWEVVNDVGVKFTYGDLEYKKGKPTGENESQNVDEYMPVRNATEYTIANPYSFGFVGVYENGDAVLYPNAWNLAKMEDYNGNYLTFTYDQYKEKVVKTMSPDVDPYVTDVEYTKECYLKSIKSSQGGKIIFVTKSKDIEREFIDNIGDPENEDNSEPDGYMDPMQRRYLSKIEVYGPDDEIVRYIDFCYEQLNVRINGTYNQDYAKRLLSSIVETSGGTKNNETVNGSYSKRNPGEEIQKESFRYIKDDIDENGNPLPLGAIDSIIGPNCGVVKYEYKDQSLVKLDPSTGLHKVDFGVYNLKNISFGTLEDGTNYLVGVDDVLKKAKVYFKRQGDWMLQQTLVDGSDGEFFIGDKNWFIYRNGNKDGTYYPFVWNGEEWEMKRAYTDWGSYDKAIVGPGYLLFAHIAEHKITLRIPWAIWAKDTQNDLWSDEFGDVDDDDNDRDSVKLYATKNHFGVFYKKEWKIKKDALMRIYSFKSGIDKKPELTLYLKDLDEEDRYTFFGDNTILELAQGGFLDDDEANVYYWRDDNDKLSNCEGHWCSIAIDVLKSAQGKPSFQAVGEDYFVARHNDYDAMTLFEYDGQNWSCPDGFYNEDMVHGQGFDWWEEAEWSAAPGYNFFVARKPRIRKRTVRNNEIKPYREYERIERVDGKWERGETVSSGDVKVVYAGSDWYLVKSGQKGFIRNGYDWNEEFFDKNAAGKKSDFLTKGDDKYSVINGEYFAEKYTHQMLNVYGQVTESRDYSILYYKQNDSFKSNIKGFFVDKKHVKDPVVDKVVTYLYDYENVKYSSETKSSTIQSYTITLPDGAGVVKKELCTEGRIALGEICAEKYYNSSSDRNPVKLITRKYERHRENNWPKLLYTDRVAWQRTIDNNLSRTEEYTYADGINDLVSKVLLKDDNDSKIGRISEQVNIYAVEKYPKLGGENNRITEKAASYQCVPSCDYGGIVSGEAVTYSDYGNVCRVDREWNYTPKKIRDAQFSFDWNFPERATSWTMVKGISSYHNGVANESIDMLGVKSAVIYENGNQNYPIASVSNAGLDEVLILPGDECNVNYWTECYNTQSLTGRSLGKNYPGSNELYGRFSKDAILVKNQKKLRGTLKQAKKSKYRFSAWIQGTNLSANSDELDLQIGCTDTSNDTSFILKGNGEWEYVEWELNSELNGECQLTLSSSSDNEIRLQDVRLVPVDAQVEVTFWDKHLGKPIAKVDDRSVGAYIEYDAAGRVVETYGETVDGLIAMKSRTTYSSSVCAVKSDKNNALKELIVNGERLAISSVPGVIEIAVKNSTDELKISWASYVDGENVFYSLQKTGVSPSYEKEDCTGSCSIIKEFEGNSMTLHIAVSSLKSPYTVKINKSTTGWIDYGKPLTEGFNPVYLSDNDVSGVRYLNKKGFRKAVFKGTAWDEYDSERRNGDFVAIGGTVNNGVDYIFALPNFTGKFDRNQIYTSDRNAQGYKNSFSNGNYSSISDMGSFDKTGVKGDNYRMTTSINSATYVLYNRLEFIAHFVEADQVTTYSESNSLAVKQLNGNSWVDIGPVENNSVKDADIATGMASGRSGVPFVAYVGSSPNFSIQMTHVFNPNLRDDDEKESENSDESNFKTDISEDHPVVVVVKHYDTVAKKWVGFSSESGDVLKLSNGEFLPNAKKVKLASDGTNLYMALLYNNVLSSQYALKVYKLTEGNSELKFTELVDQSFGSAIITYLGIDNHFDLAVRNDVPYVSFVNSSNKGNITVVKYNAKQKLWRSVGAPAFANVSNQNNSADLEVTSNSVPYVVFREGAKSINTNRKNKIVPMKYSADGDKDLTIASIGIIPETSLSEDFRQYILNYNAIVPMTVASIPFDITFSNKSHVKGIYVERDGEKVYVWKKSQNNRFIMFDENVGNDIPKFNIPLKNDANEIKIHIFGSSEISSLVYTFNIKREYVAGFGFNSKIMGEEKGKLVSTDFAYVINSSSSSQLLTLDDNYNLGNEFNPPSTEKRSSVTTVEKFNYEIIPPKDGSTSTTLCPKYNSAWYMLIDDQIFSQADCFDYDIEQGRIILTSSSSSGVVITSSSAKNNQITFIDDDGNIKIIDICVASSSSYLHVPFESSSSISSVLWSSSSLFSSSFESSSSNVLTSSNNLNLSSSSSNEYSSFSISSSSDVNGSSEYSSFTDLSSSSIFISSSSELSSSSISYSSSQNGNIGGTVIPNEYSSLYNYKFVAETNVSFENNVSIANGDYIAGNVYVAAGAQIQGNVKCSGNMSLSSNAYVKSIVLGGVLNSQAGASYGSMQQGSVTVPYISRNLFSVGTEPLNIWSGQTIMLSPGDYGDVSIYANANVTLESGVYHFKSLYIAPDAKVKSQNTNSPIQIWVQNNMRIDDRSSFMVGNDSKQVFIYGNGYFDMYLGARSKVSATVVYPNGRVNVAPHAEFAGSIWAKSINTGANAIVR